MSDSAEENAARQKRVESLTATVSLLTHTLSKQNDVIEQLLKRLKAKKNAQETSVLPRDPLSHLKSTSTPVPLQKAPPTPASLPPHLPLAHASSANSPTVTSSSVLDTSSPPLFPSPHTYDVTYDDSTVYAPFPKFGHDWLGATLKWWWHPRLDHVVKIPLREWPVAQRVRTDGAWQKAELMVRGWHIIKGHPLKHHPLEQLETIDLSSLAADVEQWRNRWGRDQSTALNLVRKYLREHKPPYSFAPGTRATRKRKAEDAGLGELDEVGSQASAKMDGGDGMDG